MIIRNAAQEAKGKAVLICSPPTAALRESRVKESPPISKVGYRILKKIIERTIPCLSLFIWHGGKTADWLLISRVFLLSADPSAAAQQRLKNYEIFTSVTQQIRQEMQN